jgi:hypothetical protein
MGRMQELARNPAMIALFAALMLTGCASKKTLPNNAADLGLAGNAPRARSRISPSMSVTGFSSTPTLRSSAPMLRRRSIARRSGSTSIRPIRSLWKAMPMNAARANTTSRWVRAAPLPRGSICRPVAWRPTASTRFRSARSARSRSVMTSPAGRRTGVRSPFSAAPEADRRIRVLNAGWRSQGRHLFYVWGFSP